MFHSVSHFLDFKKSENTIARPDWAIRTESIGSRIFQKGIERDKVAGKTGQFIDFF